MKTKVWVAGATFLFVLAQANYIRCQSRLPPWVSTHTVPDDGQTFLHLPSGKAVPYKACYAIRDNSVNGRSFNVDLGNGNVINLSCGEILRLGLPCNVIVNDYTISSDLFKEVLSCDPNDLFVELSDGILLSYDLFCNQIKSEKPKLAVPKLSALPNVDLEAIGSGDVFRTKEIVNQNLNAMPPAPWGPTQVGNQPHFPPNFFPAIPPQWYLSPPTPLQGLPPPFPPPPCPPPPCPPPPCPPPPCPPPPCPPPPCPPPPCPPPPCTPPPCPPPPCLPPPCPPEPCIPEPCPPQPCIPEPCPPPPCTPKPCLPSPCLPEPCLPQPCIPTPCLTEPCPPPPCIPKPCLPEPCPPPPCIPPPCIPKPCLPEPCPPPPCIPPPCIPKPCLPEPCPPPPCIPQPCSSPCQPCPSPCQPCVTPQYFSTPYSPHPYVPDPIFHQVDPFEHSFPSFELEPVLLTDNCIRPCTSTCHNPTYPYYRRDCAPQAPPCQSSFLPNIYSSFSPSISSFDCPFRDHCCNHRYYV